MSKKPRQHRTAEQKAELLRRHLVDKVPVSDLCNEHGIQPSMFYRWLQQLFENAPAAFTSPRSSSREQELEQKVAALEQKLSKKDAVIAEISAEYVQLKKERGEP
jgi:transposase-like protein